MAYLGKTPSQATRRRYYKTASGSETSLSGTMTTGGTLTFSDGEFVDVSVNGVALVAGTDYNTTTANTIGGLSALSANDQVEIVVYDTFSVFGGNVNGDFTISNGTLTAGTVDINGGAVDGTTVGAASASTGAFTTISASGDVTIADKIVHSGDTDCAIRFPAADNISFETGGGEKMVIDNTGVIINDDSADIDFRVESNGNAGMLFVDGGNDRVGIGTTGPTHGLHVIGDVLAENSSGHRALIVKGNSTTNYEGGSLLLANAGMDTNYGGTYLYHHKAGGSGTQNAAFNMSQRTAGGAYVSNIWNVDYENSIHTFYVPNGGVSGAAVFTINSSGNNSFKTNNAGVISTFENINSSNPDGIDVAFTATAPDNNSRYFYRGRDNAVNRYYVYSDGDVQNHDNSYGGTSDSKLKQQVADAASQWDDIKALKVRKFKFNSDVTEHGDSDALWRLGVVAQEVEAAGMTGLIKNNPDYGPDQFDEEKQEWVAGENLGTTTKAVKYSILYMKAVKALQEAMARIETLETKVAALEAE